MSKYTVGFGETSRIRIKVSEAYLSGVIRYTNVAMPFSAQPENRSVSYLPASQGKPESGELHV